MRRPGRKGWTTLEEDESTAPFRLRDATGVCTVEPAGAEVLAANGSTWTEGNRRYTEWLVRAGDPLYALGEFATSGAVATPADLRREVGAVLAEWKRDRPRLLARFDLDRDGEISFAEWQLARAAAKREAGRADAGGQSARGADVMRKPADGRLFLLSNLDPEKLARRFRLWAWAHLAILFGAVAGALLAASFV